jgi:hypothetical protein
MRMTREQLIEHYIKQWAGGEESRESAEQLADKVLAVQAELDKDPSAPLKKRGKQ